MKTLRNNKIMMRKKKKQAVKFSAILKFLDQFKMHRKIMFAVGKAIKYTLWASFGLFCYHMYLVKKTD